MSPKSLYIDSATGIFVVFSQIPWNPLTSLNRIPGLHPVGGTVSFPEFLLPRSGINENIERRCPTVDRNCPEKCRHVDENKCRVCSCSNQNQLYGAYNDSERSSPVCPTMSSHCPTNCRKRDQKNCKICRCTNDEEGNLSKSRYL